MPDVHLRKARAEDNPLLAAIIRAAFEEHDAPKEGTVYSDPTTDHLFELFSAPASVLWVAEEAGKVVGCGGIYPTPGLEEGMAELAKFYLLGAARGKGTGRALLLQCIESAGVLGYKKLYLESLPHYAKAVRMYERLGFRAIGGPLGRSGHTSCNIWMVKELQAGVADDAN